MVRGQCHMKDGWVEHSKDMYFHDGLSLFFQESTGRIFEFNATTKKYTEFDPLHEPQFYNINMISECIQGKTENATVRKVAVNDLIKAGTAMKLALDHLGGPCAMFALYAGVGKGAPLADNIAKTMHMKLIPKLALYKGKWDGNRLTKAIQESVEEVSADVAPRHPGEHASGVICLVIGKTIALGVFGGCNVFEGDCEDPTNGLCLLPDRKIPLRANMPPCPELVTRVVTAGVGNWLTFCTKVFADEGEHAISKRMCKYAYRPHAAGGDVAALSWEKRTEPSKKLPRGIFTIYFDTPRSVEPPASANAEMKAGARVGENLSGKIRCRHIIQKFVGVKTPMDSVRRKPITRSQDEAEAKMREVLLQIIKDPTTFPKIAREISECQSCLKGGLDAGDLGWFRKGKMNKAFETVQFY